MSDTITIDVVEEIDDVEIVSSETVQEVSVDVHDAITDHGLLSGLSDDDHTQYLPTDGTLDIGMPYGVTLQTGQEMFVKVVHL